MKIQRKNVKIVALIFVGLAIAFIFIIAVIVFALIPSQPRQPDPIFSPSGKRVLIPTINMSKEDMVKYLSIKIKIQEIDTGDIIFEEQTQASARMRWSIKWLSENFIQLNSSDIGILCWEEGSNKAWKQANCPE
jgi:hypothetical protein